jgi:hypothetical protein
MRDNEYVGPGDDDSSDLWNAWGTSGSDTQVAAESSNNEENQAFDSSTDTFGSSDMGSSDWGSSSSDW